MALILALDIARAIGQGPRMWLVIAGVNDDHPVRLEPVAQRQRRMVQVLRADLDVAEIKNAFGEIMIADGSAELLQLDRKVGGLHLSREGLPHRLLEAARRIHIPFVSGNEERGKEWQALDMIPVCMADQQIAAQRPLPALHQLGAKGNRAGASIEHCDRPGGRPHLDTGGVAAVAESTWPWFWDRTTSAPKSHEHDAAFIDNVLLYATAASRLRQVC